MRHKEEQKTLTTGRYIAERH